MSARKLRGLFDLGGSLRKVIPDEDDPIQVAQDYYVRIYGKKGHKFGSFLGEGVGFGSLYVDGKVEYLIRAFPLCRNGALHGILHLVGIGVVAGICRDTDIPLLVKSLTGYDVIVKDTLDPGDYPYMALMVDGKDTINWLGHIEAWELEDE